MEPESVIVDGYLIVEGQRYKLLPRHDGLRDVRACADMLAAEARFQGEPLARPWNSRHLWARPGESGTAVLSRWFLAGQEARDAANLATEQQLAARVADLEQERDAALALVEQYRAELRGVRDSLRNVSRPG